MVKKIVYILIFIFLYQTGFAQEMKRSIGFWTLTNMKGEININGLYRKQKRILKSDLTDYPKNALIGGGIDLKTKSYVWHPNFLKLGIDVDYNPEKREDTYLFIPDRSETRNIKKLNINGIFFSKKFISLNTFINLNDNYINSENLTNIRSKNKKYGGSLFFRNKYLPLSVSYSKGKWDQKEINTGRTFKNDEKNFESRLNKTTKRGDNHELSYTYNDYIRQEADLYKVSNKTRNLNLSNNIYFDNKKKYNFNSRIINYSQIGNDTFKRFQLMENFVFKLPENFVLTSSYQYYNTKLESQQYSQQNIKSKLGHQLFLSLKSNIFYEYNKVIHTEYKETDKRSGISFNYSKKIPKGQLNLAYRYYGQQQNMQSQPKIISVYNEEYIISDEQINLLSKPYIIEESITVTDITGTSIYQLNLDYILIVHNNFIEIQRLPGGQIVNGSTIYIDYQATYPGSYNYLAGNQAFSASIYLFNRLIEVYYRFIKQDYQKLKSTDFLVLNYFNQNIYGAKFKIGFLNTGFEFDNYQSSIIPYKMKKAFLQVQGSIQKKIRYSINGNIRDYYLTDEKARQQYADIFGKLAYKINTATKVNIELGYRKQIGSGIDLNLLNSRNEITTVYRKLYFTLGFDIYRRDYLDEIINYIGVDFKIIRKF
ncbi:MAG: hypothetical protein GXO79_00350 [Chlorobi bacterium]|nr:hypothetical protein [Chlorobiota bacterium]